MLKYIILSSTIFFFLCENYDIVAILLILEVAVENDIMLADQLIHNRLP